MKKYRALRDIRKDLVDKTISLSDLVQHYLSNIRENENLNVFLEVFEEEALNKAKLIQEKIDNGSGGILAGMVLALKDNICYKGHKVGASSKILEGFESLYSATVVERLLAEDVIIIGRVNCDEFAMGSSNENSAFGNVLNPLNPEMVPGGSSGGSAAAVSGDMCLAALGSDTGGSIRQPASFCGVVGFKPTYGRVSRYGLLAYASSFDQIGPLSRSVEDSALIYDVIAGADDFDSTLSLKATDTDYNPNEASKPKRIAYLKECFEREGLDPEIKEKTASILNKLEAEGHVVEAVDFPYLDYLVPTYYVITTAEASSNLSRFDGIHYGHRSDQAVDVDTTYLKSRSEGFGPEVKRRIMLGSFVLSAGYYDAFFGKGQKVRRVIKEATEKILEDFDFIVIPTTPSTAFKIGENIDDPITMYLQDIFTVQSNLAGGPSISLPLGQHSNGLPFGVQLMGKSFAESELLSFSGYLEEKF